MIELRDWADRFDMGIDDLSPPSGPGHGAGAALSGREHPGRGKISQVNQKQHPSWVSEGMLFFIFLV